MLKLTVKTPERHQWRRSGVFIVNSEHISNIILLFLLLTLNILLPAGPMSQLRKFLLLRWNWKLSALIELEHVFVWGGKK